MLKTIHRYALDNWETLAPGKKRPGQLFTLQISRSHGKEYRWGRVVHLVFPEGADVPVVAARFCRDAFYEPSLAAEAELLVRLWGTGLAGRLPRVLATPTLGGRLVVLEEAVAGTPMSVLGHSACFNGDGDGLERKVRGHFEKAAGFLRTLRENTSSTSAEDAPVQVLSDIAPILEAYAGMFGLKDAEALFISGLGRAAEALLADVRVESVMHGDFTPSNVFVSEDGGVKVIDWEFAGRGRLGFLDTMRFIYYYFAELEGSGCLGEDAFADTFIGRSNWFYQAVFEFAAELEAPLVRDHDDFRTMFCLFLAYEAGLQAKVKGVVELADIRPVREKLNGFMRFFSQSEREELLGRVDFLEKEKLGLQAELERAVESHHSMMADKISEIESITTSSSWRLTYPLRWVSALLKGRRPER